MGELVIFAVVLEVLLGEDVHFFYGVSTNLQDAQVRALANMHLDECQSGCTYNLVATHYTIL